MKDAVAVQAGEVARAYADVNAIQWERLTFQTAKAVKRPASQSLTFRAWLARFAGNFVS